MHILVRERPAGNAFFRSILSAHRRQALRSRTLLPGVRVEKDLHDNRLKMSSSVSSPVIVLFT